MSIFPNVAGFLTKWIFLSPAALQKNAVLAYFMMMLIWIFWPREIRLSNAFYALVYFMPEIVMKAFDFTLHFRSLLSVQINYRIIALSHHSTTDWLLLLLLMLLFQKLILVFRWLLITIDWSEIPGSSWVTVASSTWRCRCIPYNNNADRK